MKQYQAAAYMRLSVASSRESESESISNQEKIIQYFVDGNPDIELVSRQIDDGYSGIVFERPAFIEMIQDVRDGKIDCIIVKDLSRFGREAIETGRYLQKILPAYRVRFIAILDQIDTNRVPANEDFLMQIKTAINDEYSREISIKTRNALQTMRENGMYVGACLIYGYQKSGEMRNHLVVDENTAAVVREIFNMKLQGYSVTSIAEILNRREILSPLEYKKSRELPCPQHGFADHNEARWSASTIFRILKDETYTGALIQGKQYTPNYKIKKRLTKPAASWVRVENTHEAIISKFDFDVVQKILLLDTRTSPGANAVNLLSGILVCSCCGGRMTRKNNTYKGKSYVYYYCPAGKKAGCNSSVMIREEKLIEIVCEQLNTYLSDLGQLICQLSHMDSEAIDRALTQRQTAHLERLYDEMRKAVMLKSSLSSSLVKGIVTTDDYAEMATAYTNEIIKLESNINTLITEIQSIVAHKNAQLDWLKTICKTMQVSDFDRAGIVRIVKSILVKSKTDVEVQFQFEITRVSTGSLSIYARKVERTQDF